MGVTAPDRVPVEPLIVVDDTAVRGDVSGHQDRVGSTGRRAALQMLSGPCIFDPTMRAGTAGLWVRRLGSL